jgi:hypothetical protein
MNRLLISFSGGETSAYMTWWILQNWRERYDDILVVFANTGQENEATLAFVRRCDEHLGFNTFWIEAEQYHGIRKSAGFRLVTFETASRNGTPFEDAIRKYGIPNQKFKDCTRNLKQKPIEAYARAVGWANGSYDLAIGIRADEADRMSAAAQQRRIIYPLLKEHPMTKPKINSWWTAQPFRLELKGYQGNCKWCWKKSLRKHLTIIAEHPEHYDFPRQMEAQYGKVGPEFLKDPATRERPIGPDYHRTFFRGNMSVADLFAEYERKKDTFVPAHDEAAVFDPDFDVGAGCEESCEVFSDEDNTLA